MTRIKILGLIVCSAVFLQCNEAKVDSKKSIEGDEKKELVSEGFQPDRLAGKWISVDSENSFTEEWTKSDGVYTGLGYELAGDKKINVEYLSLAQSDDKWVYGAKMNRQNRNQEVFFESSLSSRDHIEFCNVDHESPNTITYDFIDDNRLDIRVFGKDASFELKMKKVE